MSELMGIARLKFHDGQVDDDGPSSSSGLPDSELRERTL